MNRTVTILFCAITIIAHAQNVSLDECIVMARKNYPLIKKYELIERTARIDLSDINKSWLPQISIYAQGSVQNDIPSFPDNMLPMLKGLGIDMPGIRKDQYKIGVDINQTIWDGGKSKADRQATKAEAKIQTTVNSVELYTIEERVQDLFFAILLAEAQAEQNELTAELLQSNLNRLRSMLANGTAMQSDADMVEAEYLTVSQNIIQLRGNAESYRRMLELFIGCSLANKDLECPSAKIPDNLLLNRPELSRFDAELAKIDIQRKQVKTTTMPKIGFFAQTYYGYPGYDYFHSMMSRDWTFNIMAGVKVSWAVDAFYTKKNKLSKLTLAEKNIENDQEVFLFNTNITSAQQQIEIQRQQSVLAEDAKIVELRTSVRKAAESRLANGVIDTTDLLDKITEEATASLNSTYHKIELIKTIYQLKHTLNR